MKHWFRMHPPPPLFFFGPNVRAIGLLRGDSCGLWEASSEGPQAKCARASSEGCNHAAQMFKSKRMCVRRRFRQQRCQLGVGPTQAPHGRCGEPRSFRACERVGPTEFSRGAPISSPHNGVFGRLQRCGTRCRSVLRQDRELRRGSTSTSRFSGR